MAEALITAMAKIMAQQTSSQMATGRSEVWADRRDVVRRLVVVTFKSGALYGFP